jgi:hypothetical protein
MSNKFEYVLSESSFYRNGVHLLEYPYPGPPQLKPVESCNFEVTSSRTFGQHIFGCLSISFTKQICLLNQALKPMDGLLLGSGNPDQNESTQLSLTRTYL